MIYISSDGTHRLIRAMSDEHLLNAANKLQRIEIKKKKTRKVLNNLLFEIERRKEEEYRNEMEEEFLVWFQIYLRMPASNINLYRP